jgi:hypothetical protein
MTFHQANIDLKFLSRLYWVLLQENEYISGVLLSKIIFSSKSTHPNAQLHMPSESETHHIGAPAPQHFSNKKPTDVCFFSHFYFNTRWLNFHFLNQQKPVTTLGITEANEDIG